VSSPFVSIDSPETLRVGQLIDALSVDARASVVTPNRRLAVYLKDQFDAAQRAAGRLAWVTPDILPLATFLERTYRSLHLRGESSARRRMLDAAQAQLLWEQVVGAADIADHLLSVTQTAKQAAAAWSVAQAWSLLPAMRRTALPEDAEAFLDWAQQFERLCRAGEAIDMALLPTAMTSWIEESESASDILPHQLFTAGFDIVTPQQQHFFNACSARGVLVRPVQLVETIAGAIVNRIEFSTDEAELRGCAAWARQRLAIVVPDLGAKRGSVATALADALQPGQRAALQRPANGTSNGFNISLGLALSEYALVHDALALIQFSQHRPLPFLEVSAMLRSPFIEGAAREIGTRARLDAALREVAAPELSLFALQRKLKLNNDARLTRAAQACPNLLSLIDRVAGIATPVARKPSPRDWSRHFGQVLVAWGFPGEETLDSTDFQVLEKFRDALATLATLEAVQPRMRADEALNQLRNIVAETVFQPESGSNSAAPIQVLGILESAGQSFDALWVTGLCEDAWPLGARPNPFIPAVLQRAAGVTEASAAASLALDQRITQGWRACAHEVVFSHAKTGAGNIEQQRAPSALTRDISPVEMPTLLTATAATDYAGALFALRQREPIPDMPLPALPMPTKVGGGATVLRDQAACAFRAFARHRLGARTLGAPGAGLDAAERGTLLHRVLSLVWNELKTHAQLVTMEDNAIEQLVLGAADKAIAEASAAGVDSLTGRFAEIERARLCRLVVNWLGYEKERVPFEVVASEQARDVTLAGLSMRLRLDRLDKLADGTHALIDYKSGAAKVASWLGDRLDEPQLPLYFHTAEQTVSALAFARVKRGARGKTFGFEGVSAAENLLIDVGPIENKFGMEKRGYISWDVLVEEWEDSLNALATGFIDGDATVDPKNGNLTCAQCDLQSVCRISELTGAPLSDDDNGGSSVRADDE
jgi:ATP-dependent helicase/nuclease subunit B